MMGEELKARAAINEFLAEDRRISQRWGSILSKGQAEGTSFEQLAGRIEEGVTSDYRESFEQLSALKLDAGAPSAKMLEQLRRYAELREQASQQLSEGLRKKDPSQIRQALANAQQAPEAAKQAVQAGQPASQGGK